MSGHQVIMSYARYVPPNSADFAMSHTAELSCFLAYECAFYASLLVFMDVKTPYTVDPRSRSRKVTLHRGSSWSISYAIFSL